MFYNDNILYSLIKHSKTYNSINASNVKDIAKAWITRWLSKRINRKETLEKLCELGPETIKNQLKPVYNNNLENNKNVINIKDKSLRK
jgi:hypothetical protein